MKMQGELETRTREFRREQKEYERRKADEWEEFEAYREAESKKMTKERRVHDRQTKAMQSMPNRKERDELDKLKKEMDSLTEEMKKREQRNKLATERVRRQLEEAQRENSELEEEAA